MDPVASCSVSAITHSPRVATVASRLFGLHNQLDDKQLRQLTAPAFVCSGARLQADLGWAPQHDLDDTLAHAAAGYRRVGML